METHRIINALTNFKKAFSELAGAWTELQCSDISDKHDLTKNYPFTESFDDITASKWLDTCLAQLIPKDSIFTGLAGRTYKTKLVGDEQTANFVLVIFPEYGVLAETKEGIHLALLRDEGTPTEKKPIIQCSPGQILVGGIRVANNFPQFAVYCFNKKLVTDSFKNWPFELKFTESDWAKVECGLNEPVTYGDILEVITPNENSRNEI